MTVRATCVGAIKVYEFDAFPSYSTLNLLFPHTYFTTLPRDFEKDEVEEDGA